jgi:hypothetical protein
MCYNGSLYSHSVRAFVIPNRHEWDVVPFSRSKEKLLMNNRGVMSTFFCCCYTTKFFVFSPSPINSLLFENFPHNNEKFSSFLACDGTKSFMLLAVFERENKN